MRTMAVFVDFRIHTHTYIYIIYLIYNIFIYVHTYIHANVCILISTRLSGAKPVKQDIFADLYDVPLYGGIR